MNAAGPLLNPWLWVVVVLTGLVLVLGVRLRWRGLSPARIRRRRARVAAAAELAAEQLLASHGYQIVARQPERQVRLTANGRQFEVTLRADLLVRRGGRQLVAEVKSGAVAPLLQTPATRRQLLEYRLAYPVSGALLVDMHEGRVHEVHFGPLETPRAQAWPWLLAGLAVGASLVSLGQSFLAHLTAM